MKYCIAAVLLVVACAGNANAALTTTIDFSELPDATNLSIGSPYVSPAPGEFQLTTSSGSFGTIASTFTNSYSGSTSLHKVTGGTITLARVDAAAFSLQSIDLAELTTFTSPTAHSVTFTGQLTAGGTVMQTFTLDALVSSAPAPQNFTFDPQFFDVTSVAWDQSSGAGTHQFDNIIVGVPEPTSFLLLAGSLCATTLIRRRRS